LNIFLSGKLHELPRQEVGERDGLFAPNKPLKGWRRIPARLGVAMYLVLPFLAYALVVGVWKIQVQPILTPLCLPLYVIWVVVGLLPLMEKLNPEAQKFVTAIFEKFLPGK
jgi:hypothetical protein